MILTKMESTAKTILDIARDTNTLVKYWIKAEEKEIQIVAPDLTILTFNINKTKELMKVIEDCPKTHPETRDCVGKYILENDIDTTGIVHIKINAPRMNFLINEYQRRRRIIKEYIIEKPRKGVLTNWGVFSTLLILADKVDLPREIVLSEIGKYLFYPTKRNN